MTETSTKVHKCPSCGGTMSFAPDLGQLKCNYCGALQAIEALATEIIENNFEQAITEDIDTWSDQDIRSVTCKSCGAQLVFEAHTKAQFCSYCGSSHIEEQAVENAIPPAYLIPFSITDKQAGESFKTWISKRWFAPNDLKKAYENGRLMGTYVPFWTFDSDTGSHYTADRGDHYYVTKTRTVNGKTETYQERHTRWTSVSGSFDHFFDDVLVCASSKIDGSLLNKIDGVDLSKLTGYQPQYLSGFFAERYSIPLKDGWDAGRAVIDRALESEARSLIGGDEVRFLKIHTTYEDITFKHILLPIWISSYTYKEKLFHFLINGQTGFVSGEYPKSPWKIGAAVIAGLAVLYLLYFLISNYA